MYDSENVREEGHLLVKALPLYGCHGSPLMPPCLVAWAADLPGGMRTVHLNPAPGEPVRGLQMHREAPGRGLPFPLQQLREAVTSGYGPISP